MKNLNFLIGIGIIVLVVLLGIWTFGQRDSGMDQTIQVGLLVPLTGGAASYGENSRKGVELALQEYSADHPDVDVKLVVEDSRGEAAQGVRAAQKLVDIDKVVAVVGCVTSGVTLAVAPTMNERKVPIISPGASSPNISEAGKFVFRTWPSDVYEAEAMARHLADIGVQRLAVLRINNEYGLAMEQAMSKRLGPETRIVISESFEQGSRDMRTQLLKIKDSGAEALYFVGFPEAAVVLGSAYSAVGLDLPIFATSAFEDPQIPEKTGGVLNGTVYTKPIAESPAVNAFRRGYKERYGVDPGVTSDTAYDAAELILQAISDLRREGKAISGALIRERLHRVKAYPGASGTLTFNDKGDVVKPVGLFILKDGKYQSLPDDHGK